MKEGYNNYQVQHVVLWQVVVFRLPAIQQVALTRLHPHDFMPIIDASSPKGFWVMRQEKTMALVCMLQACAKESGAPTGILCDAAWEIQRCMPP